MAYASTLEWDVRTTGSDSNGGAFDPVSGTPGTDYSQQDSPQVVYTDLVIDGTTNTKCTSAGTPFTSVHVDNVMNVVSGTGFTVQRVQILSVSGGVATCDKSLGTLSSTGGHANLGGAMATFNGVITANNTAGVAPFLTVIHIKSGTYTITTGVTLGSNYSGLNMNFIGYGSTHRDGGTRPLLTTATNSTKIFACYNAYYHFENINWSNTAGTRADGIWSQAGNPYLDLLNCTFDGFAVALNGDNGVGSPMSAWLRNVEIKNSTSDGIRMYYWLHTSGCWIHANGRDGIRASGDPAFVIRNSVISGNTGIGINVPNSASRLGLSVISSSVVSNTSDGIFAVNSSQLTIENSIVYSNGGFGLNAGSTIAANIATGSPTALVPSSSDYNAYGSNTSGNIRSGYYVAGPHDVTLSANPFTNSGAGDFSLNATAGGGAACKQAAFPGVSLFGTGALDIGAVQTSGGAGGGSAGMLFIPGLDGV
jgi:hypothetical protein